MNLLENLQTLHESEREEIFSFKWEKGSVNDNIKNASIKRIFNGDIMGSLN